MMFIPKVWLIIIAAQAVGGPVVEHVPYVEMDQCAAAVAAMREQKPEWMRQNTVMICSATGDTQTP